MTTTEYGRYVRERVARKQHRCAEDHCREPIMPGDRYVEFRYCPWYDFAPPQGFAVIRRHVSHNG